MSQNEQPSENLDRELKDYKKEILPVNKGWLKLERDLYFTGATQRGYEVEYDPAYVEGCSPTETLLLSIAGCLSIDVVIILRKMRCEITRFEVAIEGTRKLTPPQHYTSIDMVIQVAGEGITPKKMDRAIQLSQDKYCSVYHSLRKDITLNIKYDLNLA